MVNPPWHGGAPVKESVVKTFVDEVFALKGSLEIRHREDFCNCDDTDHQMKISEYSDRWSQARNTPEANWEQGEGDDSEKSESEKPELDGLDRDEDSGCGFQYLGVQSQLWNDNDALMINYKDVAITSSLRTYSWGPVDGAPRKSIGIGPRNGLVMLGTRLKSETDPKKLDMTSRRWKFLSFGYHTRIPVKLLRGPWTKDRLYFLHALIETQAYFDPQNETQRRMAKQSLTQAIREDNYRAVDLLTIAAIESQYSQSYEDNYVEPSFIEAEFLMDVCDGSRDWIRTFEKRRTLGITPDTEHLKLAVIERGCRRKIVKRLLWAKSSVIDRIDRTDPAVVHWAEKKKEEGDRNGQWLLNQLTESGDRTLRHLEIMRRWGGSSSYDFDDIACVSSDGTESDAPSGDEDETRSQDDSGGSRTPSSRADIPPYESESEDDVPPYGEESEDGIH